MFRSTGPSYNGGLGDNGQDSPLVLIMTSIETNKGGLKPWATPEQKQWLTSHLASYISSKSTKTSTDFWSSTFEEWFQRWPPDAEPTADGALSVEETVKRRKTVSVHW